VEAENNLAYMMKLTGYVVPTKYGTKVVGNALAQLREQFKAGVDYRDLNQSTKECWRRIVKHNVHDLKGMKHVLMTLSELAKG
jgi:hypothetical protein